MTFKTTVRLLMPFVALTLAAGSVRAGDPACDAYHDLDYEKAVRTGKQAIQKGSLAVPTQIDVYKCMACSHVALRQLAEAKSSIAGMLTADAAARFSPDYNYPPPVIDLYYVVHDSLFGGGGGVMDIATVAIGDFEDNSVYQGKYKDLDYSLFARALVHTVGADLAEATDLKIVDRQRTDTILREIELGQSGFADPENAVQAGKLLGAHTFIFGQYMILSKNKVRIDARVVHTATGEIILTKNVTGDFGGDPEKFLELERELVVAIAEGIEKIGKEMDQDLTLKELASGFFDEKGSGMKQREAYVEAQFMAAKALELEDAGKYDEAKKVWRQVREIDPANDVAVARLEVLDQFAMK